MTEFRGNKNRKKKLYFKIFGYSAIFLSIVLIRPTWNIWTKYVLSSRELDKHTQTLKELTERESYLNAELKNLETVFGQEKEIVGKFNLVRDGEELAIVLEQKAESPQDEPEDGFMKSFFRKYFGWVIGR